MWLGTTQKEIQFTSQIYMTERKFSWNNTPTMLALVRCPLFFSLSHFKTRWFYDKEFSFGNITAWLFPSYKPFYFIFLVPRAVGDGVSTWISILSLSWGWVTSVKWKMLGVWRQDHLTQVKPFGSTCIVGYRMISSQF